MAKKILIFGGVLNLVLTAFHVFLGYQIYQIKGIAPQLHELLIMLNAGGTLFILLFTIASFFYIKDMLTTRLGKLLIRFVVLLYASRALEEIIVVTKFDAMIFWVCIAIAALYASLLFIPVNKE
ncbi:MAG: hypothetical protein JXA04_12275 [Gammaproteobacteria bacterium]|nr:hypothetical protein [Gammaproteobacteria bacterium]